MLIKLKVLNESIEDIVNLVIIYNNKSLKHHLTQRSINVLVFCGYLTRKLIFFNNNKNNKTILKLIFLIFTFKNKQRLNY